MEKLTAYLLVPREWDDKSKFLAFQSWNDGQTRFVTLKPRKEKRS